LKNKNEIIKAKIFIDKNLIKNYIIMICKKRLKSTKNPPKNRGVKIYIFLFRKIKHQYA